MTIIDLTLEQYEGNHTHPVHGRTPLFFNGTGSHGLTKRWRLKNPYDGSAMSVANEYVLVTGHTGTHVDAPFHVDAKSAYTVEKLPLERMMGTAVWLDLSPIAKPGLIFESADLEAAERECGEQISPGDIVLLHTGWLVPSRSVLEYVEMAPALSRAAGDWLRAKKIKALAVDLPSPDSNVGRDLPVHMNFLRPKSLGLPEDDYILIYENVVNIVRIPKRRFEFVGLPIPFRGATGSPVRAIAVVQE